VNLHEYQAKNLFREYAIPVSEGIVARTLEEVRQAAADLKTDKWVVKAQAQTGARGKAGGVVIADSLRVLEQEANRLLGSRLITKQTGSAGLPVESLLIEKVTPIHAEYYLSILPDRDEEKIMLVASSAGGMDIEAVASESPERIETTHIDPAAGLQPYQCRQLGFRLGLNTGQIRQFQKILFGLERLVNDKDLSLIEINPLVVTESGDLIALDAKINIDDNALHRQPDLLSLRDIAQEDEREAQAKDHDLNFIALDGEIGCMVNGAGLAMATMDLVKLHGGRPANFLDVGGGATAERVAIAFKLILSDPNVTAILVNIFGGIVRCDLIAEGILKAVKDEHVSLPVVVRLEGTNARQGLKMLNESGFALQAASDLSEAADLVVAAGARS
jgi:succinyl-CoA synthetase beta subunit